MTAPRRFALCVQNRGFAASLEVRKVYALLPDAAAKRRGLVPVVDESGEDYLFPAELFVPIEVPPAAARAFLNRSA
ncbi:MAG TPA: hypothetical protein VF530_12690 [Planctomycetota bacterium]